MRILLGAFIFGIIGLFTFVGVMTPGVGWFLYVFLIPFWAMFPIIIVGPRDARAARHLRRRLSDRQADPVAQPWYQKAARDLKTKGHASIGGFVMTARGRRSSGFSSGGGGGGFSGGGGSSGGGGARAAGKKARRQLP